jgi:hypothetical protein
MMMAERAQSFENHRRWLPLWHFFVIPVLLVNVILAAFRTFIDPFQWPANTWNLLVTLALFFGVFLARYVPLLAQNRIIRLEERQRVASLLPAETRGRINELTMRQYIALRFAPDDEIPDLVRRCLAGELKTSGDIKRAIKNWRADHLRV